MSAMAEEATTCLRQAEATAADGRWLEAIDRLQAANVSLRDPAIDERLVELRRDAVPHLGNVDPPRPSYADPFPTETGLVEIEASDATPAVVAATVEHHGCILVRNLLSADRAESLVDTVERAFDGLERSNDGADATSPWYRPFEPSAEHPAFQPESRADPRWYRVCMIDSPRAMFEVIHHYTEAGVIDIAQAVIGTRPVMTGHKWALRRMPRRGIAFWHQEAAVFDHHPLHTVNVWMALSPAGGDAPGFEVLPRRETELHPTSEGFALSNDTFDRIRDRDHASPLYGPGDAMIFDEYLIHRTKTKKSMDQARYSIESWFFSPGAVPPHERVVV